MKELIGGEMRDNSGLTSNDLKKASGYILGFVLILIASYFIWCAI